MANLKEKNISELDSWSPKELRKLKMVSQNRIGALQSSSPKELSSGHPLFEMEVDSIKKIVEKINKIQKGEK